MLDFAGVLFFVKDKQKLSIDSTSLRIFKLTILIKTGKLVNFTHNDDLFFV